MAQHVIIADEEAEDDTHQDEQGGADEEVLDEVIMQMDEMLHFIEVDDEVVQKEHRVILIETEEPDIKE